MSHIWDFIPTYYNEGTATKLFSLTVLFAHRKWRCLSLNSLLQNQGFITAQVAWQKCSLMCKKCIFLSKPPFIYSTLPQFLFMSIADLNRLVWLILLYKINKLIYNETVTLYLHAFWKMLRDNKVFFKRTQIRCA